MSKQIIYAKTFLKEFDFYHLAKQFYKHIYRNNELEQESEWKEIKRITENFLVEYRSVVGIGSETTDEKYREFLRFYTELEIKYEDPTEFVFTEPEKEAMLKFVNTAEFILKQKN